MKNAFKLLTLAAVLALLSGCTDRDVRGQLFLTDLKSKAQPIPAAEIFLLTRSDVGRLTDLRAELSEKIKTAIAAEVSVMDRASAAELEFQAATKDGAVQNADVEEMRPIFEKFKEGLDAKEAAAVRIKAARDECDRLLNAFKPTDPQITRTDSEGRFFFRASPGATVFARTPYAAFLCQVNDAGDLMITQKEAIIFDEREAWILGDH